MEISFLDDDLKPQGRRRTTVNGVPVSRRLKPDQTSETKLDSPKVEVEETVEQMVIRVYLKKFQEELGSDLANPRTMLSQMKRATRNQGEMTRHKEDRMEGKFEDLDELDKLLLHVKETNFLGNSVALQRWIFNWVVNMPYKDKSKAKFSRTFEDWLSVNFRSDYNLARGLVRGALGPATAVDLMGGSKLKRVAKIIMNNDYDVGYAVDLRVDLNDRVFLIQVKTVADDEVDPSLAVVDLDEFKGPSPVKGAGRMKELAVEISAKEGIKRYHIKRVLITVPAMGTKYVEGWTGFVKDNQAAFRKQYEEKLEKIGFKIE